MNDETHKNWLEKLTHLLVHEPKNREELLDVLREAQTHDILDPDSLRMIEGVIQVSEKQVREIMIARAQMVVIEEDMQMEEILKLVVDTRHSRYPVVGETRDKINGILLAKDLLRYRAGDETHNLKDLMRPAIFVPESKRLDILLREFRLNRNHMAIVVDEYGGVSGLVTIEDVLEEIVGEIEDEYDIDEDEALNIKKLNDDQHTVKALTPIEDFNEYFNTEFSDEEFDTIGGLIIKQFGHLPQRGEFIEYKNLKFKVLNADKRRVYLFKVSVK